MFQYAANVGNDRIEIWNIGKRKNSMSLREYLKELKIDQIEDDTEFCDKEYNAIMDYCTERKFLITDDDLACIVDRGMNDSYEYRRAQYIKDLWLDFGNVPMNPNTECIEEEWNGFAAGWHRTSICDWFEESYGVSVVKDLMGLQEKMIMAKYIVDYYETYGKTYEVEEINESYLIDGVATCCGYDFGIDMYKVKFCPICGKKLIIEE